MVQNTVSKKYDFFNIYRHTKRKGVEGFDEDGNSYDLSLIDEALLNRFNKIPSSLTLTKLGGSVYVGITNISCYYLDNNSANVISQDSDVDLAQEHLWVFNIEKVNTNNEAVVVEVTQQVDKGRTEYGSGQTQGAAKDTVVCFNPQNGVVILPPRSGVGISRLLKFFYYISGKKLRGLYDSIIIDDTSLNNILHMNTITDLDVRVTNLIDKSNYKGSMSTFNSIKNKKMALHLYGGNIVVAEAVKWIRRLLNLERGKKKQLNIDKIVINGSHNGEMQTIDLVTNRMVANDDVKLVNGKIVISEMMESVKRVYMANKTKLDISHKLKGGQGV
ncbi:hypothetical protein [Ligilactobacillus salivarius]|uniref:hypothetical protein n=1 Tax=Ligilactobacillus salivarius TaxID=1624 RepID=UPI003D77BE16